MENKATYCVTANMQISLITYVEAVSQEQAIELAKARHVRPPIFDSGRSEWVVSCDFFGEFENLKAMVDE